MVSLYHWGFVLLGKVVNPGPGTLLLQALECLPLYKLRLSNLEMSLQDKNADSL